MYQWKILIYAILILLQCTILVDAQTNVKEQILYDEAQALIDSYCGNENVLLKAKNKIENILKLNPNSALGCIAMCRYTCKSGYINYDNYEIEYLELAQKYFDKALSYDNKLVDIYFYGYYLYRYKKRFNKSEEMALKVYNLDSTSGKSDLLLADMAARKNDIENTKKYALSVVSKTTNKKLLTDAYGLLSYAYKSEKNYKLAEKYYLEILKIDTNPWSLINYCSYLCSVNEYDKAIKYGKKSLMMMDFGMGHYQLARAYNGKAGVLFWDQNNIPEAQKYFLLALEHDSTFANSYYGLAAIYYSTGYKNKNLDDLEKAEKYLLKTLYYEPAHSRANEALKQLRNLLNRF